MTTPVTPENAAAATTPTRRQLLLKRAAQIIAQNVLFSVILFVCAGTLRWMNAWAYFGLVLVLVTANGIYVVPRNPEIIAERGKTHRGTRAFDHILLSVYSVLLLGMLVLAGLDGGRFHWAALGWPWALAGGILLALAMVPTAGALAVNRHLEPTVRIQHERGHQVVSNGPYRWIRHPMYLGMITQLLGTALLLGSAWALVPALAAAIVIVLRTLMEDRTLVADLPGYAAYARTTRYRLVPGLW